VPEPLALADLLGHGEHGIGVPEAQVDPVLVADLVGLAEGLDGIDAADAPEAVDRLVVRPVDDRLVGARGDDAVLGAVDGAGEAGPVALTTFSFMVSPVIPSTSSKTSVCQFRVGGSRPY
jgi:hypothetical protein